MKMKWWIIIKVKSKDSEDWLIIIDWLLIYVICELILLGSGGILLFCGEKSKYGSI